VAPLRPGGVEAAALRRHPGTLVDERSAVHPRIDRGIGLGCSMAYLAVLAPGILAVTTLLIWLSASHWPGWTTSNGPMAFVTGVSLGIALWVFLSAALVRSSTVQNANPNVWRALCSELDDREAWFAEREVPPRAVRHLTTVAEELESDRPAIRWAFGMGYVDLWRRLHRVDEARFDHMSDCEAAAEAVYDCERIEGSAIPNGQRLLDQLRCAIRILDPDATSYLRQGRRRGRPADGSPALAREIVRSARRGVNDFRDDCREGLVRARTVLLITVLATGIAAFLLLGLAVVEEVPAGTIAVAAAYYLVAAIVGLVRQLRDASSCSTVVGEDYGLAYARLIHTPLFSGIAGVAGVVLVAVVGPLAVSDHSPSVPLAQIFNLKTNELGLVVAAVFGLTPTLLLTRLQQQAESYKADLKSSEIAEQHAVPAR
jgi:hypothetical protein